MLVVLVLISKNDLDGPIGLVWSDDITEVCFHVATLIPTREQQYKRWENKKRHIGNDFVNIVFSDSSEDCVGLVLFSPLFFFFGRGGGRGGRTFAQSYIVFYNLAFEFTLDTIPGQFNFVWIVIRPLDENCYHIKILCKEPALIPAFGPLCPNSSQV